MTERRSHVGRVVNSIYTLGEFTIKLVYEISLYTILSSRYLSPEFQAKLKTKLHAEEIMTDYFFRAPVMSQSDEKILKAYLYQKCIPKPKKPKMSFSFSKDVKTAAPNTFSKFTLLPHELQDMIWEFAADAIPARTIDLRTVRIERPGKLEEYSQYIYVYHLSAGMRRQRTPRHTHTFGSPNPPPALLSVSYHARAVAKRHYEFAFRPINSSFLGGDTLCSQPYVDLIDREGLTCPNCTCCTHGIYADFSKDIFVPGPGVFGNEVVHTEWANDFIADLYGRTVFHESRESIHKIQRLALPLRSMWTRNTVTFHLGFLPGVKEVLLVRTRGFDKKAEMEVNGREVVVDVRPPVGKDGAVFAARTRGCRVLSQFMRVNEAKAVAEMLFERGGLTVQDQRWKGPEEVGVWTATVKKRRGDGKMKKGVKGVKGVWETISGRRLKDWMGRNYIPPNFG